MSTKPGAIRALSLHEIDDEFGPLVEIPPPADGGWDMDAIREALANRLLWTRVEPGLVSTGLHYVNRDCYLRAALPYGPDEEIVEVDPDFVECAACGETYFDDGRDACPSCGATTRN